MSSDAPPLTPDQEDEVRALLAAAAATIDVPSGGRETRRLLGPKARVMLLAAVVVALCALGIPLLRWGLAPATPDVPAVTSPTPSPSGVDTGSAVPWSDRTDAVPWVAPSVPEPGYVDPPARWPGLQATLTLPSSVSLGSTIEYVVTLTNHSDAAVDLAPCPAFVQQWWSENPNARSPGRMTGRLNCDGLAPIPVGGSTRFVMRFAVPAKAVGQELLLMWELVDGHDQGQQEWIRIAR
ncbi:hypothetical protein [Nocardioides sp.]|uniref:hypothetical protein n=1 Tax=Nocardioides sp. TaxID=35761 RepID=UPI0026339536|nr:hypothetical protein [Nocardioides sp.]